MSKRFRKGLVAGKFSPLHLGHEALIEYASIFCDQVLILSYADPEFPKCGRAERERWIKGRFPQMEVCVLDQQRVADLCSAASVTTISVPKSSDPPHVHHAFVAYVLTILLGTTVDALFTSEAYGDRFAAALTAQFANQLKISPTVTHVCYDIERKHFPYSATDVRRDIANSQRLVSSNVYASIMPRIAVIGAKGTGKTTLTKALAAEFDTGWLSQLLADEETRLNGDIRYEDVLRVARLQVKSELVLARRFGNKLLICDTSPISLLEYSLNRFGAVHDEVRRLAYNRRYDYTVVCSPIDRSSQQQDDHDWYVDFLKSLGTPHIIVTGTIEERVAQAKRLITL